MNNMKIYNKLVRDKIPSIMEKNGEIAYIRQLGEQEYKLQLEKKLDEEIKEYHESNNLEELADILEVVYALCEVDGYTIEELQRKYVKKHEKRGGFSKRIFLIGKE